MSESSEVRLGEKIKHVRCCCGQLNVQVKGEAKIFGVCHCDNCKRRTGSAFGISLYFRKDDIVTIAGKCQEYAFQHKELDHQQQRYFCTNCGTTVYWYVSDMPELIGVAGGCFADKDSQGMTTLGKPRYSANHSNRCDWLALSSSIKPR